MSSPPGDIPPSPPTTIPDWFSHTYPSVTVTVVTHTSPAGQDDWVSQTSVYWHRSPVRPATHSQLNEPSVFVHVPPDWQGSTWDYYTLSSSFKNNFLLLGAMKHAHTVIAKHQVRQLTVHSVGCRSAWGSVCTQYDCLLHLEMCPYNYIHSQMNAAATCT